MRRWLGVALLMLCGAQALQAKTLNAGQGAAYATLAAALAAAEPGDTIHLAGGDYFECASITLERLVIEGEGPATTLTDRSCEGKGALVIHAGNVQLRNLTLARQRVPDGNGAGIRLEAQGLTLDHVRFENDEVGLLAQQPGAGVIRITNCIFSKGGVAGSRPTAAVNVGDVALLHIEGSAFEGIKGGQIVSSARRTELVSNHIATGSEPGAGFAVDAQAGVLVMQNNVLAIGPNLPPRAAAVLVQGVGAELRGNQMQNTTGQSILFLLDWMHASPLLANNAIPPGDTLSSSSGLWRHRAGGLARSAYGEARGLAGAAKRAAQGLIQ